MRRVLMRPRTIYATAVGALAAACQMPVDGEIAEYEFPPEWGITELAVAPAGSDALMVSDNIPVTVAPGERLNTRVTVQNTGTVDWSNTDWVLYRQNNAWAWVFDTVTPPVAATATTDFDFIITAPATPGAATFAAQMFSLVPGQNGFFGGLLSIPITVDGAATPRWSCSLVSSTVPATIPPGASQAVSFTVQNTGTATWSDSGLCLYSRDSPLGRWGSSSTCVPLSQSVAPGGQVTFNTTIRAPSTPGVYELDRQMFDANAVSPTGGVGLFSTTQNCLDLSVNVTSAGAQFDASLVSEDFPTTMNPGEVATVTVVLSNDGVATWPTDGSVVLLSRNSPVSLWGVTQASLQATAAPAANGTFTMSIVAPTTAAGYNHTWQLYSSTAGYFGPLIDIPVTVAGAPTFDSTVVSQTIPTTVTANDRVNFEVTMQNTGTAPWDSTNFGLNSANTPYNRWTTVFTSIPPATTINNGDQVTFTFEILAPSTPGTYDSRWIMRDLSGGGPGNFGATAVTLGITVQAPANCGNGVVDSGETCDDGNVAVGDGCNALCLIENSVIDLASDTVDRTVWGTVTRRALGNVEIGDVTNDGVPDVVMAEYSDVIPSYNPNGKALAGRIHGYSGTTVLSGGTTQAGVATTFEVWGNDPSDLLGGGFGSSAVIGDVTGDGVADVIASAPGADGVDNMRDGAGEIYVVIGQAGLATAGVIDLGTGTATASGFVGATIIGPVAGTQIHALGVADVTNDGVGDIIIGAPGDDTVGVNSGVVMVVAGGPGLLNPLAPIDLAVPANVVATIVGAAADDRLGNRATTGLIDGDGIPDLLLGTPLHDPGGRSNAGAAWAILGPLSGTYNLPGDADVIWYGQGANDRYGYQVGIGNVRGTATNDVVIGALQQRNGASQQVGAVDIWQGPTSLGTRDLSLGALPNSRILGADQFDGAGANLAVTGDMNGDGFNEIIVISSTGDGPTNGRDRAGELAVVLGASSIPATVDLATANIPLRIYGADSVGLMGIIPQSLAVGDIDGDNRADFCVGSYQGGDSLGALIFPGRVDCHRSRW